MRIAILGAGFAGLAVSWFLLHYRLGSASIDLFDPEPIGGGVSGLSSGLLHVYPGKEARQSWRAPFCMKETHRLITEASHGVGHSVVLSKGILRPALTPDQIRAFQACAQKHEDTEWWDARKCTKAIPGLFVPEESGALFIKEGLTIDVQAYLLGLWQTLAKHGVQFQQIKMMNLSQLKNYDRVLFAMGPTTKNIPQLNSLPLTPIKGQILELEWPSEAVPLAMSLISHKYLVMGKDLKTCTVGATFEREFDSFRANKEKAASEILPDITSFFPALKQAKILRCRSGFRACSSTNLPLVGKISDREYFFTGLGSKGLLYHAWVGKRVARAMLTKNDKHFPHDIVYDKSGKA